MDPYAILATLGFGVFLFNVIFNLLNNQASGRSLDVYDLDVPLALSDVLGSSKDDVSPTPYLLKRTLTVDITSITQIKRRTCNELL